MVIWRFQSSEELKGAEAPERFVMTLFKRRSNLERLLEEFSWLWAVNHSWSPHHRLEVATIGDRELSQKCPPNTRWWVYATKSGGWGQVYPVTSDPRINVATAVCSAITCGDRITHVVSRYGEQPFTLYRAPKDTDMHVQCCNRYDRSPIDNAPPKPTPSVEISRKQYLDWIAHHWPDKDKVISTLTMSADILSRDWPPYPVSAVRNLWIEFGRKVERAQTPDECVAALFHVLEYLACPEPGWDGVELKFVQ